MYNFLLVLMQKDRYIREQKQQKKLKHIKKIKVWENKKVIKEVEIEY